MASILQTVTECCGCTEPDNSALGYVYNPDNGLWYKITAYGENGDVTLKLEQNGTDELPS